MSVKSHPVPKVGDTVRLNKCGLETCFGNSYGLSHMMTLDMKVVHVDRHSMTAPELAYNVEVDHPDISMLMVTNWGFDIVRSA